jgi:hypothetical protein
MQSLTGIFKNDIFCRWVIVYVAYKKDFQHRGKVDIFVKNLN